MHLDILITYVFSSFLLTISPGPDILYIISQSITRGKKTAIITSFGLTTGLLFHTFFVIFGLSFFIKENENIFLFLKIIGFFYFLYLALMVFLNRKNKIKLELNKTKSFNSFKKGLLMNLINPKVSIFFIAFFPGFVFNENLNVEFQFLILGLIFWFQANLIFIAVSIFSNKIKNLISSNNFFFRKKYIVEICIYVFIGLWILK
jgi:threonine/homoserine/homoserine lactone efflux protein